jgi:adenylate kinase
MKTFLFHGYPGSGKDTQVNLLVERYGFENIGTGEMIRNMYKDADIQALKAYEYLRKGYLVPNDLIYEMLGRYILQFDSKKKWAFVSVVREPEQVILFDELLQKSQRKLEAFVHLTLSPQNSIERISLRMLCPYCDATYNEKFNPEKNKGYCDYCGTKLVKRDDDQPEKVLVRQKEYEKAIAPILKIYKERNLLIEVDASPSIEEIHKVLVMKLGL